MTEFSRSLAVVIGINEYQNGIARLKTAVADAVAIATILQDNYQYQLIHPKFETGIIINGYATGDRLRSLFTDILPNKIEPTKSDRLLLYFAGHGIARSSDTGPEGYLIPQDGEMNDPDSLIKMGDLHQWLSQLECRHLLVILDCCFAGSFRWASTRKLISLPETIHWEHYHRFVKYPAWQVITSAAHNQEALDFLNNRDRNGSRSHSPFAEGLIKAIGDRQADLLADGVITTPELYLYLRDYVELNSQERQTPGFFPLKNHDRGEYIFKLPNLELKLEPAPKLAKDNNPYRGLEPFEESHASFFFGREEVIRDLATKVTQQQLTVVLGISGAGKSSLVKAGLIPYLRQQGQSWHILPPLRPGSNPYGSLARSFLQLEDSSESPADTKILGKKIQNQSSQLITPLQSWTQQNPNSRLLLVIDQFEELITLAPKAEETKTDSDRSEEKREEHYEFITLLVNLLQQFPQLTLVITLRSDFEPRFLNSALQSDWANSRFVVRGMRSDELRDAVEQPATEMALYFEPANLVDRLVDEIAQTPGALPLLSFTLSEMYISLHRAWLERGREDRALTVDENFDREGGVAGSLTRRANEEYYRLPDDAHRQTMRRVMLRMVDLEGGEAVKRRVLKPELIYPSDRENQRVELVLNCLIDTRLIVTGKESESDQIYYEPAHDFLVRGWDKLQNWLQERQGDDLALQRLVTPAAFDWQEAAKSRLFLWNANPHLELLQQILTSQDNWFNRVETEFVCSSIARKRLNVRLRWSGAIAVIILLSTGLILALLGQREAKIGQSTAAKQSARVNLNSERSLDAMLNSLEAGTILQEPLLQLLKPSPQLQQEVAGTLQSSIYRVKELNRMQGDTDNTVPVRSVFNPQGNLLASAEENGIVRLWNRAGEELASWQADPQRVRSISFSPDRDVLVSGAENGSITLWNFQGQKLTDWQGHSGQVRDLSFSNDGRLIASAGAQDGIVALWDLRGKELERWQAHKVLVKSVGLSPDIKLIATAGGDKTIRIWDLQGSLLQQFPVHSWKVVFSPDGKLIASAGDDGYIRLWNRQLEEVALWQADRQRLWNIAFSPDGRSIASAGEDGSARIWNLQGEQIAAFTGHTGPVRRVSFSKDGAVLASSGDDGTTRLWTLAERHLAQWQGDDDSIHDLVFSSDYAPRTTKGDRQLLYSGGEDGVVRAWNLQGERVLEFAPHPTSVRNITINPDGKMLASGSREGIVRLWNLEGRLLQQFSTEINSLQSIVFSPDGQLLATAGGNGRIRLWDLQGQLVSELLEHRGLVYSLSFSPDGKLLASAGSDGTVITWDWQKQKANEKFQDHIGEVYTVAFSPNGKWLASGGQDSTVRLWNIEDNSTKSPLHIYEARVNSVAYSPDGKTVISGDDGGFIRLWDFDNGESLASWQANRASVRQISLNSEGNILATAGTGEIKLWRLHSFAESIAEVCFIMQDYLEHNSTVEPRQRRLCE